MNVQTWWTIERVRTAASTLAPYRQWCEAARAELSEKLGREVSYDMVCNGLRRAGLGAPGTLCHGATVLAEVDCDVEELRDADSELERILIVPDAHHPCVDPVAWNVLLATGRMFKPHRIIVLGDFCEMFATSRHAKDPNRNHLLEVELEAARAALTQLDDLGATHKHYLQGNHEENLERFLMEKAPALFNVVKIEELFNLADRGWTFTKYRQHLKVGKVHYVHDTGSSGATAHIRSRDAFAGSVVQGHTHHAGVSYAGTARGDSHVGISSGWLGKFDDMTYAHDIQKRRAWFHAFTLGWMEPDGVTHLQLIPIINGRACVNGQMVAA